MGSPSPLASVSLLFVAAFLRLAATVDGADSSDPSFTPIPRALYHPSESLLREIKALAGRHPDRLRMEKIRAGNRAYLAEIVVVTCDNLKKRMNAKSKFRILLSFGQHGRELITTEVALRLLYVITQEHDLVGVEHASLENVLDNVVIKVVPMENLHGRRLVEEGDFCERKNGRGVDLNRNWSVDWGKKEKDYDPYEENPGAAPFSEPEAQLMRDLCSSFDPHIWVNVHSGMEALFMPYDHKNTTPVGVAYHLMKSVLEALNHRHFQDKCLVGSGGGSVGYLAHGTTTDYIYDIGKVPMTFTFEIYGDQSASAKDCFRMFNPVDKTTFDRVIDKWCMAFLMLFDEGPRRLEHADLTVLKDPDKWISIGVDTIGDSSTGAERKMESSRMEGLDLGLQELRTYFRLFMLSCFLLMFMFCSRISKSKSRELNSGTTV